MATDKPYTLKNLIINLTFMTLEGAAMVAFTTWVVGYHDGNMGAAYLFAALIALLGIGLGALQIRFYRQERTNT